MGGWGGYRTGALAQACGLLCLGIAYASAALISLSGWSHPALSPAPRILHPYLLGGLAGFAVYAVGSVLGRLLLRKLDRDAVDRARARGVENPKRHTLTAAPWNRGLGVVLGALKGGALSAVLVLTLYFISAATLAIQASFRGSARPAAGGIGASADSGDAGSRPSALERSVERLGEQLQASPIGGLADRVSPLKVAQAESLGRLSRVIQNPEARARIAEHPTIRRWKDDPRIQALSKNREIVGLAREARWSELIDHPAIVELARDRKFLTDVRSIDPDELIRLGSERSKDGPREP